MKISGFILQVTGVVGFYYGLWLLDFISEGWLFTISGVTTMLWGNVRSWGMEKEDA